jgi:Domain of unknown function (DUF362)
MQIVWFTLLGAIFSASAAELFPLPGTNAAAHVTIVQSENIMTAFQPDAAAVEERFNLGFIIFSRGTNLADGWRKLVSTNDTVGIKVFSQPGPVSGTRPAVVTAVIHGLRAAGVPADKIIIWDKREDNLRAAGFFKLAQQLGVQVAGAVESGFDTNTFYLPEAPVPGNLVWGDVEFGITNKPVGKKSYVSKLVSQRLTKIISVAPLMNENEAGTCGHFYNVALGSVDNTRRFTNAADRLAIALPEIYALPAIGDHVALLITDALLAQYQGGPASYLQFSRPRSELWFSRDPVALDLIALRELGKERKRLDLPTVNPNLEIYHNAALLQLGVGDTSRIMIEKVR